MPINEILLRPLWFIGIDTILELISLFITSIICLYSYKVFKVSNNHRFLYLAFSFFLISAGFILKVFSDLLVVNFGNIQLLENAFYLFKPSYYYTISILLYSFFTLSAYLVLAFLSNKIIDNSVRFALAFVALLSAILVEQARSLMLFYFLSFVILSIYVVPYFYENYRKQNKNLGPYLVFLSFLFLIISNFIFTTLVIHDKFYLYIIGQSFALVAYLILLINLLLLGKK